MLEKLKSAADINNFFEHWYEISESKRLETIRDLRINGSLVAVNITPPEEEFKCPINGFTLARPCNLSSCHFNINAPDDKNCLVNCVNNSKHGRLSAVEVANLLNTSVSDINSIGNFAIKKIRKAIIHEAVDRDTTYRYDYIEGHCVHCELSIHDELEMNAHPELVIEFGKFGWCSHDCREKKPKWVFLLENEFRCSYKKIFRSALSVPGMNPDTLDDIFNLEPGTTKKVKNKLGL